MSIRKTIDIRRRDLNVSISFKEDVSVINLLNEITYLLDRKFIPQANSDELVVIVYLDNICSKLKGEHLEKELPADKEDLVKMIEKIHYYAKEGCGLNMKTYGKLDFSIPLQKVSFGEDSIKINDIILDNLENVNINIEFYSENYDKFDFDNLNEIKICKVTFSRWFDKNKLAKDFIDRYKGRCDMLRSYQYCDVSTKLFYESGSMIMYDNNKNYYWRIVLFISICNIMFYTDRFRQGCKCSSSENDFENNFYSENLVDDHQQTDDLLMNPMVITKIASYLNQK